MNRFRAWSLLLMLLPLPSRALEFRRVGELRLESSGLRDWLDPHRYVRVKNEWDRTPKGALRDVTFVVADVLEQKLLRLPFAFEAFRQAHPTLFTGPPNVELVWFDGSSAVLKFDRKEPGRTLSHYSFWNPRTQALSEPKAVGEALLSNEGGKLRVTKVTYLVGPDPGASRLYFAEARLDERARGDSAPLSIRLFRATLPDLEVDWEMDLPLPRRSPQQLPLETHRTFSFDGKKLAMAEYYDRAYQRAFPAVPPPQVYVVDLERKQVARYPIPRTPYGLGFSRDGRYLAVGSHEEDLIVRIDLQAGRVDRRVKAQTHIQELATTASGDALIVMSDHIGTPRSIEIRRWSDLGLVETIPVSRLFPGLAGLDPSGIRATWDGRHLVAPRYAADGYPDRSAAGLVTFAIDEGARAARVDPVALVREHVERSGVKLYSYLLGQVGNGEGHAAPIVANGKGEAFVVGTTSDLPEDAPYQEGKSHPYAMWIDARGKVVWARSLRSGTVFRDYQGAGAVATPDGDFIAFLLCSIHAKGGAYGRLVRLDRRGKVVWDWTSPVGKEARFPESVQLLPSGKIVMKGHMGTSTTPWVGTIDAATGKLLRDEVGGRP